VDPVNTEIHSRLAPRAASSNGIDAGPARAAFGRGQPILRHPNAVPLLLQYLCYLGFGVPDWEHGQRGLAGKRNNNWNIDAGPFPLQPSVLQDIPARMANIPRCPLFVWDHRIH
jgi:hypothetical protein